MGAVGGEDDHGGACVVRFHDAGEEVADGGAGSDDEGCVFETEGEKAKASFVVVDVEFCFFMFCSGECEGRASRAGSEAKMFNALLDELINDPKCFVHEGTRVLYFKKTINVIKNLPSKRS